MDAVTAATFDGTATDLEYDAAGNVTRIDRAAGDDRFVVWDARNLATSVTEGSSAATSSPTAREEFQYGPSGSRYLRDSTWQPPAGSLGGTAARRARTFYAGGFEETHVAAGDRTTVVSRTRVTDNVVLVQERVRSGGTLRAASERVEYLHRDHLGSVVAVSNAAGGLTHRLAYDPYGARRAADWSRALTPAESAAVSDAQPRGFTGHEHLDRVGLIHANARLFAQRDFAALGGAFFWNVASGNPRFRAGQQRVAGGSGRSELKSVFGIGQPPPRQGWKPAGPRLRRRLGAQHESPAPEGGRPSLLEASTLDCLPRPSQRGHRTNARTAGLSGCPR